MTDEPPEARLVELASRVGRRLGDAGLTLVTAESCTGGLVGHLITEISGSSVYYVGGVVTYSDALKRQLLNVSQDALDRFGAVSAEVAAAMAVGARSALGGDVAIAVTGIAGPDGGSPDKPVGLAYIAAADPTGVEVRRLMGAGSRTENKQASAIGALELLLERLP